MLSKEEEQKVEHLSNVVSKGVLMFPAVHIKWLIEKLNETNDELKKTNEILTAVRTDKVRVVNQLKRVRTELEQVWRMFT